MCDGWYECVCVFELRLWRMQGDISWNCYRRGIWQSMRIHFDESDGKGCCYFVHDTFYEWFFVVASFNAGTFIKFNKYTLNHLILSYNCVTQCSLNCFTKCLSKFKLITSHLRSRFFIFFMYMYVYLFVYTCYWLWIS